MGDSAGVSLAASPVSPRAWRTRGVRIRRADVEGSVTSGATLSGAASNSVASPTSVARARLFLRFGAGVSSATGVSLSGAALTALVARVRRGFGAASCDCGSPDISPGNPACSMAVDVARVVRRRFGAAVSAVGSALRALSLPTGCVIAAISFAAAVSWRRVRRRGEVRVS